MVEPRWLVDCVAAQKLLPTQSYLYAGFKDPTQSSLLDFTSSTSPVQKLTLKENNDSGKSMTTSSVLTLKEEENENSSDTYTDDSDFNYDDWSRTEGEMEAEQASSTRKSTKTDPSIRCGRDFVRLYFATSRLHHIGTWRTTFQMKAEKLASNYKGPFMLREPPTSADRVILHVDMDSFFVAVAVRGKPEYQQIPVAVAHSTNAGTSGISSCNYLARDKGVKAGMFMQTAKSLCPNIVVLPYKFEEIQAVSLQIYEIFFSHTPYVQAMSCDEALLEFDKNANGIEIAKVIRAQIMEKTQCTASVGVSYNILLAKIASKHAKPNGIFSIRSAQEAEQLLLNLQMHDLPGVGYGMNTKLQEIGVQSIEQLRQFSRSELEVKLGKKSGTMLYNYIRGNDFRPVSLEANMMRKSVSAVVNFGIRFESWDEIVEFMEALAEELACRLKSLNLAAKSITLQVKKRRTGQPIEPVKYMGHGICDNYSKSFALAEPTADERVLALISINLLQQLHLPTKDIRGIGLQVTKVVALNEAATKSEKLLRTWLAGDLGRSADTVPEESYPGITPADPPSRDLTMSQIDLQVLSELPEQVRLEVLSELDQQQASSHPTVHASRQLPPTAHVGKGRGPVEKKPARKSLSTISLFRSKRSANENVNGTKAELEIALNDIRMSQVDHEVYQALPMNIRREIDRYAIKPASGFFKDANANNPFHSHQQKKQVNETVQIETIEEIVQRLLLCVEADASPTSTTSQFDAILARILLEIENLAIDRALQMLRYTRRKCATVSNFAAETVRTGFNQILNQVNEELRTRYDAIFAPQLVAFL